MSQMPIKCLAACNAYSALSSALRCLDNWYACVFQDLSNSTKQHQPVITSLQREMGGLSSREGVSQTRTPYNIGLLKEEVSSITMRWDNVCRQVSERYLNLY